MSIFVAPSALGYCSVTKMGSCTALAPATCLVADNMCTALLFIV